MKGEFTKQGILDSVFLVVAEVGLENTTTKKIAIKAKISEGLIYKYFAGKNDVLEECFACISREVDLTLFNAINSCEVGATGVTISQTLWNAYLDYWISNPSKTIFYDQYRHSFYYTREIMMNQIEYYKFFVPFIQEKLVNFAPLLS